MSWREKRCGLGTGFLKSPDMAGVGMPQFYGREIATGESAQVTVTLGDAVSTKSPMKMIYRKFPKNSVTRCHPASPVLSQANFSKKLVERV